MPTWSSSSSFRCAVLLALLILGAPGLAPAAGWAMRGRPVGLEDHPVRIGVDASYPPFAFVDSAGSLRGLEVDLAHELGRRLGLQVELRNVDLGNGLEEVAVGDLDLALAGLVPRRDAEWQVWYSAPYLETGTVLVGPPHRIRLALQHGRVAVERGSIAELAVRERWPTAEAVVPWLRLPSALALLESGAADALALDRVTALRVLRERPDWQLHDDPLYRQPFTIAIPRANRDLWHAVNAVLEKLRQEGLLAELEHEWLVASEEFG